MTLKATAVSAALALFAALGAPPAQAAQKAHAAKSHSGHAARVVPNTGKPGSPCRSVDYDGTVLPPNPGTDTTSLGPSVPAGYEMIAPTSTPERGQPVQRVMMFIHGGGWYLSGPRVTALERGPAAAWAGAGWEVVSIDYRACRQSMADVLSFYDIVRAHFGSVPICVAGESAGAQLALMVAARRSDVSCVIGEGSPTDLLTIAGEGRREARAGTGVADLRQGAAFLAGVARAAFGKRALSLRSPVASAAAIHARVLLGTGAGDNLIPYEQGDQLLGAMRGANPNAYVDVARLAGGPVAWIHAHVSQAALDDFAQRAVALVAPFGRAPASPAPTPPAKLDLFGFLRRLLGGR